MPVLKLKLSHNPYFSRWFSAMLDVKMNRESVTRHNPYFSRWFSAIEAKKKIMPFTKGSQSLF
mgnify:CR=1 FL=1